MYLIRKKQKFLNKNNEMNIGNMVIRKKVI